jgi:polar amino acid transport system permease protein
MLGLGLGPWTAAAIALTLHASAFLGEIWRGCIEAVPEGQSEASWALGLSYFDRMQSVVLPQAARIAVAPTVGFLVQLIKGTSLASIIGFVELMRAGQIVNNATFSPFKVYGLVALIYFFLCWPLSILARRMEGRYAAMAKR